MSVTVRIVWQYILSRVRVSVRPSNFFIYKSIQNLWEIGSSARAFIWMTLLPAMNASGAGRHGWAPTNLVLTWTAVVCVCVRAHVHAHACVRDLFAIYDNKIWPRLIMIIKIIILGYISYKSQTIALAWKANRWLLLASPWLLPLLYSLAHQHKQFTIPRHLLQIITHRYKQNIHV